MSLATAEKNYRVRTTEDKTASGEVLAGDRNCLDFLQLLGRAVRQFQTYPATSPLCVDAIDATHRAFATLDGKRLLVRVAPHDLIVDNLRLGRGSSVEQDLAKPLYRARVASLEIDPAASIRDWSQFCAALIGCHRQVTGKTTLAELLLEAGVAAIVVRMIPRPEVFNLGVPAPPVCRLIEHERARQTPRTSGGVQYFYPPDKGWVRLDPSIRYSSLSLVDLAVAVNDPMELAAILMRLTDDDGDGVEPGAALEQKYGDVVTVLSALDPRLARQLFAKLARAVLELDSPARQRLLRRSILPGLLDGCSHSDTVLTEFPDVDLADALCLLLDLEAAAPDLLPAAIDRLQLPSERRSNVVPLVKARLSNGQPTASGERRSDADLSRYAGALIRIDATTQRNFAGFAAFDLSLNDETLKALTGLRTAIADTAAADARLACLSKLAMLEPNPAVVGVFLDRSIDNLRELARGDRWSEAVCWVTRFQQMAAALQTSRPEVADIVRRVADRFCSRDLVLELVNQCGEAGHTRVHAEAMIEGLGRSIVPAWLDAFDSGGDRTQLSRLVPVLSARARDVAPAIARALPSCGPEAIHVAMELLGAAGAGYEAAIAGQLSRLDQRGTRDALRALARIGTTKAAAIVVDQIENGPPSASAAAEEALWRLPTALASATARELLGRRSFVVRHPETAARLFGRVTQGGKHELTPLLEQLGSLRFHVWKPAVARIGVQARRLLR